MRRQKRDIKLIFLSFESNLNFFLKACDIPEFCYSENEIPKKLEDFETILADADAYMRFLAHYKCHCALDLMGL